MVRRDIVRDMAAVIAEVIPGMPKRPPKAAIDAANDLAMLYEELNDATLVEMSKWHRPYRPRPGNSFGSLLALEALSTDPRDKIAQHSKLSDRFKIPTFTCEYEDGELVWEGDAEEKTHHNPSRRKEWGFDLTDFKPGGWSKVLCELGIDPAPSVRSLYAGDPRMSGKYRTFIWTGRGIEIVTSNNPISGESGAISGDHTQKNFAGFIGIRGTPSKVMEAKRLIKRHASYLKDARGSRGLDYIGFEENPTRRRGADPRLEGWMAEVDAGARRMGVEVDLAHAERAFAKGQSAKSYLKYLYEGE